MSIFKNRRNILFFVTMKEESEESSMDHHSYTTEEVAKRLKVSKLTVYDLIKKENFLLIELVDRCALMTDLDQYIKQMKTGKVQVNPVKTMVVVS